MAHAPDVSHANEAERTYATLLLTHPGFADHDTGRFHVERAARLQAIDIALAQPSFAALKRQEAALRGDVEEAILRAHSRRYLDAVRAVAMDSESLPANLDGDTVMSAGSWTAALRAVGAGLQAVDAIMTPGSGIKNAFCQVRPPGHHAERERAMGFCIFANAAIAAHYARAKYGVERVAVVDFDVHHGNGTQRIFWDDRDLFYGSTHEMPLFPGTGAVNETGVGNIFNAPLRAGDGGTAFHAALSSRVLVPLRAFKPDVIVISAGFDAHADDPLGHLELREPDFSWATEQVLEIAAQLCGGRVVSMLEGGYDLKALALSAAAHVAALMKA